MSVGPSQGSPDKPARSGETLTGSLAMPGLATLLQQIAREAYSGVLYLRTGQGRRRLYLTEGALVLATSTVPGERLGDYLLSKEVCSRQDLAAVTERSKAEGTGILDLLREQGRITAEEHGQILSRLSELIVFNAGDATDGDWEFVPGSLPSDVSRPPDADLVLWTAMLNSYEDWRKVYRSLADVHTCLVLAPDALKQPAYKDLGFAPKQLLSHFSRERAVGQVARGRVMNRFEELLTLARCVELNLLQVTRIARDDEVAASEVVEAESTLPLSRSAIAAAKSRDPERAEAAVNQLIASPPARSQVVLTAEDRSRRRQRAQELLNLAQEQNKQGGDVQKAMDLLQLAMQLDTEHVELPLTAAEVLSRSPRRVDEAETYARKALSLQPNNAKAHLLLGKIYVSLRRLDEARSELTLAAEGGERGEAERLLATLTKQPLSRPAQPVVAEREVYVPPPPKSTPKSRLKEPPATERPARGKTPAPRGKERREAPAPAKPAPRSTVFSRKPVLATGILAIVLAGWGYGMFRLVLWRLENSFGPLPDRVAAVGGSAVR